MTRRIIATASLVVIAGSTPAFAHLAPGEHGSFLAGFTHPLFGLDHILAMVAVGLWAAMLGHRATALVPAAFVAAMLGGFAASLAGVPLAFVEPTILASLVAFGLLAAMAVRLPTAVSAAIVAVFAVFHGHAHGGEIGGAGVLGYAAGFALATALLHAGGVALGIVTMRATGERVARTLGAVTAAAGVLLMVQGG